MNIDSCFLIGIKLCSELNISSPSFVCRLVGRPGFIEAEANAAPLIKSCDLGGKTYFKIKDYSFSCNFFKMIQISSKFAQ